MWYEREFMSDRFVVRMTPHQRLMYRALCQAAMFCSTRPYLPNDDEELTLLADADSVEHWKANRGVILKKFQEVTVCGKAMLAHKRVLADWAVILEKVKQASDAGRKSAESRRKHKSTDVERPLNERPTERNARQQTETETEKQRQSKNKTETETVQRGAQSGSVTASHSRNQSQEAATESARKLSEFWHTNSNPDLDSDNDPVNFEGLLRSHDESDIRAAALWALTISNYGRPVSMARPPVSLKPSREFGSSSRNTWARLAMPVPKT